MKILVSYPVSDNALSDFMAAQTVQAQFSAFEKYDKIVVSNAQLAGVSLPFIIVPEVFRSGYFCLPAARNAAIDYAVQHGYDWLVLVDADAVIVNYPTILPKSGFGHCLLYRTTQGETAFSLHERVRWWFGWYVLHRDRFVGARFDENFVGCYGGEGSDFTDNVMADVPLTPCDLQTLHRWHPVREMFHRTLPDHIPANNRRFLERHAATSERRRARGEMFDRHEFIRQTIFRQ